MRQYIRQQLANKLEVFRKLSADEGLAAELELVAQACCAALRRGNKILLAGNGGSAADAQHLAAELVSRFQADRPALPALALTTDTSVLTAIANDCGYERVFARQVEALGTRGDILIAISTSGRSPNVLRALEEARRKGLTTVGFTGASGGDLVPCCDHCIRVPASETPDIQECHIAIGHILCGLIECELFGEPEPARKTAAESR